MFCVVVPDMNPQEVVPESVNVKFADVKGVRILEIKQKLFVQWTVGPIII